MNDLIQKYRQLSERERLMLSIGVFVVLITFYAMTRFLGAAHEIAILQEQTATMQSSLRSTRIPKPAGRNASTLQRAIQQETETFQEVNRILEPLESEFVASDSPEAVQGLMVLVSRLAATSGVFVMETSPVETNTSRRRKPKNKTIYHDLVEGGIYERPVKRLVLEGNYFGVRRFLTQLPSLSNRIVVLRFSIEAMSRGSEDSGSPWLVSEILVAL